MTYRGIPHREKTVGDFTFKCLRFSDPIIALNHAYRSKSPRCCILGDDETVWIVHPDVAEKLISMGYEELK